MNALDAPARYFRRIYPVLRGAHGPIGLARHVTEPGQSARMVWVLDQLGNGGAQRVLDAGCGIGGYAVALARRGHHVTAADLSPAMLEATARAAHDAGVADRVELEQCDLRTWRPGRTFDTVLSLGVAEYYRDAGPLLEQLYEWTDRRLLVTWSARGVGPRALLRRTWLALHGVEARLLGPEELARALSRLPAAEIRVAEMFWAHCAIVERRGPHGPREKTQPNGHAT